MQWSPPTFSSFIFLTMPFNIQLEQMSSSFPNTAFNFTSLCSFICCFFCLDAVPSFSIQGKFQIQLQHHLTTLGGGGGDFPDFLGFEAATFIFTLYTIIYICCISAYVSDTETPVSLLLIYILLPFLYRTDSCDNVSFSNTIHCQPQNPSIAPFCSQN